MIRFFDEPAVTVAERLMGECPTCCGNGEIFVQRLFGRAASEPYLTKPCGSCGGTGQVEADAVAFCDICKDPFWADDVCTHQGVPLCEGCKPPGGCRDCGDERAERAGAYR